MSLTVRIVAPFGRDADLIKSALLRHDIAAEACTDVPGLLARKAQPIGPLLIAEEALTPELLDHIAAVVRDQPAWSDLPVLILTGTRHFSYDKSLLGNAVLLERPLRTDTLVSSVRAALRARERQYQVRDALQQRDTALLDLQRERETLRVVLDNLPVGILVAKPSGEIVLGNRRLESIFRHPILETLDIEAHGRWVAFHPNGRRVIGAEFPLPRALKTAQVIPPEEYLYQRGDGTTAWISLTAAPMLDENGQVSGAVVAVTDIDQEKRSAEMLSRSEERFRRLIEHANVGVLIEDETGKVLYANPYLQKLLGLPSEQMAGTGTHWDELTPPEYRAADAAARGQIYATGMAEPYQMVCQATDGRLIPFIAGATVIPSEDRDHRSIEIAVFLTDLSSQKMAEAALLQSEKLAAVGRLASTIAHEINNPLEAITNALYLLHQEDLGEQAKSYLAIAEEELYRVSQIAVQTLRFHRQATKPQRISPELLLEPVVALYKARLLNSCISLQVRHKAAAVVTCYEGEIRQVLSNLVANAQDAMRNGGKLLIRTGPARDWTENRPGIHITIADTGHGIPPEVLEHIFDAFYTTKGQNGTGLGLWVSSEIIQKHRGRLRVRSSAREGFQGTVFRLFLPQ